MTTARNSIYFELAEQNLWGVNGIWPFGTVEYEQSQNNIEGFQICYPLTSLSTVNNPTTDERVTRDTLDMIWNITVNTLKRFSTSKDRKVPAPTFSTYATAKGENYWTYAVKPIYNLSKTTNRNGTKFGDDTKQMQAYIKLATNGKGKNIKCHTKIHGPGDKKMSPFRCISVHGSCHPVKHWDGVYWGSHGRNSYGASVVRLKVSEMNFSPCMNPFRTSGVEFDPTEEKLLFPPLYG